MGENSSRHAFYLKAQSTHMLWSERRECFTTELRMVDLTRYCLYLNVALQSERIYLGNRFVISLPLACGRCSCFLFSLLLGLVSCFGWFTALSQVRFDGNNRSESRHLGRYYVICFRDSELQPSNPMFSLLSARRFSSLPARDNAQVSTRTPE